MRIMSLLKKKDLGTWYAYLIYVTNIGCTFSPDLMEGK